MERIISNKEYTGLFISTKEKGISKYVENERAGG